MLASLFGLLMALGAPPASAHEPWECVCPAPAPPAPPLARVPEAELPDFRDGFPSREGLERAARKGLAYLERTPKPTAAKVGDREVGTAELKESLRALLDILASAPDAEGLARRVRETFDAYRSAGSDGKGKVVFSSYYQPVLRASLKRTPAYPVPLYRRPPDLVTAAPEAFGKSCACEPLVGRVDASSRLVPYYTREEIDLGGALARKGLEVAWLSSKWEALDLHIQGSGILELPGGRRALAKYAATNAHPYRSVGLALVEKGVFKREEIGSEALRAYIESRPKEASVILAANPRYTFFEVGPLPPDGQPFGTARESLVPERSIAIDPAVIPLGAIAYFTTTSPKADEKGKVLGQFTNSRFALCLDTGGAIKGPGRVDIYTGNGPRAAAVAKGQWAGGELFVLLKKPARGER